MFGKILRNECDEEFRLVQARVKNTIQELLKVISVGVLEDVHSWEASAEASVGGQRYPAVEISGMGYTGWGYRYREVHV